MKSFATRVLRAALIAVLAASGLSGCFVHAVKPQTPEATAKAAQISATETTRANLAPELAALQADPQLASRAPDAIKDAQAAVAASQESHGDPVLLAHLAYIADRKIKLARAIAETKLADDQRVALAARRDEIRARADVQAAEAARERVLAAQAEVDSLREQVAALQPAQNGGRMTIVLPEVLLEPGHVNLSPEVASGLDAVAAYLAHHPETTVKLEGRTPGRSNDPYALRMSQSRADGVRGYLARHDVAAAQLSAVGLAGENVTSADGSSIPCNRCVLATLSNLPEPIAAAAQ